MIKMIIGLGNPGPGHVLNRHNVGFLMVDGLAHAYNAGPSRLKNKGAVQEITLDGQGVFLFKPLSYMNLSGGPASGFASFYKIDVSDILVIHDDLDVAPGRIRVKKGGGAGGHNGLKSLDAHIGSDYWRLRIGIGRPDNKDDVSAYVLDNFSKIEQGWLENIMSAICDEAFCFIQDPAALADRLTARLAPGLDTRRD